MPFIRYKTNDYVKEIRYTQSKEFKLPILFDEVIGRVDDIIRLSDGKVVLPVTVRMNVKPLLYDGANYQIIQNDYKVFTLNLIDKYKMLDHKRWKKSLFKLFGDDIIIDIIEVDSLITKGGKIRNVISRIQV
jgi:phenylacetate-coenzyme A ligase PaaK-like adenylate-forming protein